MANQLLLCVAIAATQTEEEFNQQIQVRSLNLIEWINKAIAGTIDNFGNYLLCTSHNSET